MYIYIIIYTKQIAYFLSKKDTALNPATNPSPEDLIY